MELEIVNYIKEARSHGLPDQEIKQNLLDVGWDPGQVEDSFTYVKVSDSNIAHAPAIETAPKMSPAVQQAVQPSIVASGAPVASPVISHTDQPQKFTPIAQLNQTPQQPMVTALPSDGQASTKPKGKNKLGAIFAVLVAIIVLGAGGYFAYAYLNPTPTQVWDNFLTSKKSLIGSSEFSLAYSDPGVNDPTTGKTVAFTVSLNGSGYTDASSSTSPILSSSLDAGYQLTGASGTVEGVPTSGDAKFKVILLNNVFYIDLSGIPAISQAAGQQLSWVKLDEQELVSLASSTPYGGTVDSQLEQQKQMQSSLQNDLTNILKSKQLITATKIMGTETVNGVATYHLQNQLDKSVLKQIINTLFDDETASSSLTDTAEAGAVKQVISTMLDKVEVSTFETWVGKKDSQMYKVKLDLKFPGIQALLDSNGNPLGQAESKSRDSKRVADMRQMSSALELFYNDHNGYPAAVNGAPQNITPGYMDVVPIAPSPSDGSCTDYYNAYWYTPTGTPTTNNGLLVYPSYEYTFCLGSPTGNYKAGIAKMTQTGIQDNVPCTDKPENCTKQQDTQQTTTSKPEPQADFLITATYSDYGKKQDVTAPSDSLDIVQWMQKQMGGSNSPMMLPTGNLNDSPSNGMNDSGLEGQPSNAGNTPSQ